MRSVTADVLLVFAVLIVVGSAAGVALMRDVYQKLHFVTPVAVVAPVAVGLAVLAQSGWSVNALQTWLVVVIVAVAAPFTGHATAKAARTRDEAAASRQARSAGPAERRR